MKHLLPLLLVALLFAGCGSNTGPLVKTSKLFASDPFKKSMVTSQVFDVDMRKDNVVEGDKGTRLVFPKGCFKNAKGDVVENNVKVELAEALGYYDMLASNLTTTSGGKPLETDGMIYFNATTPGGEQLAVDPENPVHIEIPTDDKKPGMMAYSGTRDTAGNMDWTDPVPLDNYLVTVDLNTLDFTPKEFTETLNLFVKTNQWPYKSVTEITRARTDSLYYTMTTDKIKAVVKRGWQLAGYYYGGYNEAYYNTNKKVENGKYTKDSYNTDSSEEFKPDTASLNWYNNWGPDPMAVKIIKNEKFQHTLIATREFAERLKNIQHMGDQRFLDLYVNNLNRNMYEIDSMVEAVLADTAYRMWKDKDASDIRQNNDWEKPYRESYRNKFHQFYLQHLTKIKDGDKDADLLKDYYEKQVEKNKAEQDKQLAKIEQAAAKKDKQFDKLVDDYKELLWKREKYRMQTYSFNWTKTGWINIDNGDQPKTWAPEPLQVTVANGGNYEQVYTYVIYTSIKSLYRLNSADKINFYAGNNQDKAMLMPKGKLAVLVAVGYKGDSAALDVKPFTTETDTKVQMELKPSSQKEIKKALAADENYKKENRISVDLSYMKQIYQQQQQRHTEQLENGYMQQLWFAAHPFWWRAFLMPVAK